MKTIEKLLDREAVQTYLGISKNEYWRLVREKPHFKTVKVGRNRLMREEALQEFLRREEEAANP